MQSHSNTICVILPYILNDKGTIESILVSASSDVYTSIFNNYDTGLDEYKGKSSYKVALQLFEQVFNIAYQDSEKWKYLGTLNLPIGYNTLISVYSINLTDSDIFPPENYKYISALEALKSDDALLSAGFIRLYREFWVN